MLISFVYGGFYFIVAFLMAIWIYRLYSPWSWRILLIILLCALGFFCGAYAFTYFGASDAYYFYSSVSHAYAVEHHYERYEFLNYVSWYIKQIVPGVSYSYLSFMFFTSSLGFLGSILWYLFYLKITQLLKVEDMGYVFNALILLCWPSFFIFTSGSTKDAICHFMIPIILICGSQFLYGKTYHKTMLVLLFICLVFLLNLRFYVILSLVGGAVLGTYKGLFRLSFIYVATLVLGLPVMLYLGDYVIFHHSGTHLSLIDIGTRGLVQQGHLARGSYFPLISDDPVIFLCVLPYHILMNLFMPLFIFASNPMQLGASLENLVLLLLVIYGLTNVRIFDRLYVRNYLVRISWWYFLIGMTVLGLINRNIGLATRQKAMYLPALLILILLIFVYRKNQRNKLIKASND